MRKPRRATVLAPAWTDTYAGIFSAIALASSLAGFAYALVA